ncbi:MAG: RNA polymerase sigma factor [Bacteroidia bacterium]|nr:RNA polymerase sigma factor [Bacteroidia bacterium]
MEIALKIKDQEKGFIQACIQKEKWAQRKLYLDYYSKMMGVCLRYAKNNEDAQDILHDGFIKVYRNIDKYKPGTSLTAWIHRIMVNTSIDFYRKAIRRRTDDLEQAFHISSWEVDVISKCSEKDILKAVQSLSPAYRAVFNLYVIEGYPHKEIANILNITESTSRSNLVKARIRLKELLAPIYSEYGKK